MGRDLDPIHCLALLKRNGKVQGVGGAGGIDSLFDAMLRNGNVFKLGRFFLHALRTPRQMYGVTLLAVRGVCYSKVF